MQSHVRCLHYLLQQGTKWLLVECSMLLSTFITYSNMTTDQWLYNQRYKCWFVYFLYDSFFSRPNFLIWLNAVDEISLLSEVVDFLLSKCNSTTASPQNTGPESELSPSPDSSPIQWWEFWHPFSLSWSCPGLESYRLDLGLDVKTAQDIWWLMRQISNDSLLF